MAENNNFETIDFEEIKADEVKIETPKNIFSDFNTDTSLENIPLKQKKENDLIYKLNISLRIFQTLLVIIIIALILGFSYIFIQKDENSMDNTFLEPICFIFNWDIETTWCPSISYTKQRVENELKEIWMKQSKMILSILPIIYERNNFLNTKEISFLKDKSLHKLEVLEVLEKFDYFKSEFTWYEKKKIRCKDITINSETKILSMKCEAYSASSISGIIWFSWDKNNEADSLSGTSISLANSFINYLEKNAKKYFLVVNRQKTFDLEDVDGNDWYTKKTSFDLNLKINF